MFSLVDEGFRSIHSLVESVGLTMAAACPLEEKLRAIEIPERNLVQAQKTTHHLTLISLLDSLPQMR